MPPFFFFLYTLLVLPVIQCSFFGNFRRPKSQHRWLSSLRAGQESSSSTTTTSPTPLNILFLMDGFCPYHGDYLAACAQDIPNTIVIPVLSNYLADYCQSLSSDDDDDEQQRHWESLRIENIHQRIALEDIQKAQTIAVYCESDSGLADAEQLRQQLVSQQQGTQNNHNNNVLHDNPIQSEARRNKYLMQQCVQENTSLPTVQQKLCHSLDEALDFAKSCTRVVMKPHRGVASESVRLCDTTEQIEQAWDEITSSTIFGARQQQQHSTVVVQEFLEGTEYAVDVVSRNGHHKVAAVWRYDKRPVNGAPFCYFQTKLVDTTTDPNVKAVCEYVQTTLDALGIQWGLSHNEVIVLSETTQPMLVEVNCRQHNMDFAPVTMACIRYNAFNMLLDAFFGGDDAWNKYPDLPTLQAQGCMVHLVNYAQGSLVQVNHLDDLANLPSILDYEVYEDFRTPQSWLEPTKDIRTDAGWVQLVHENPDILQQDYEQIVTWMPTMFTVDGNRVEE